MASNQTDLGAFVGTGSLLGAATGSDVHQPQAGLRTPGSVVPNAVYGLGMQGTPRYR